MLDRRAEFDLLRGVLVEAVGEDRCDAAVGVGADGHRPCGSGLKARLAVGVGQAQQPQAGAIRLLGVTPGAEHGGDECGGVRTDVVGPSDEALWGPLAHLAVLLGHVLVGGGMTAFELRARVARDALAAVQELHGGGGEAHVELAPHQGVRDRVVVPVDLDVVVDVDPDLLPLGEHVALGGQRAKGGTVELLEQRAP